MWLKAIKGAFIVAGLVLIKSQLAKIGYAPFIEGLLFGTLYGVGFVLIHVSGGVLATKQPAMTASTLAAAMDGTEISNGSMAKLCNTIMATLRTQIVALLGNYLFAFPFSLLFCFVFWVLGADVVNEAKADYMLHSIHPWFSLSLIYAAIAGVCLFLAGIISGLASNWYKFNKITLRISPYLKSSRDQFYVKYMDQNFGILVGNIVLGYMLGSMAAFGKVVGLPLDIRHVTFASGSFGIGWFESAHAIPWLEFSVIGLGVFSIGLINLAVSFSLSLFVAMKSRSMKLGQGRKIIWLVFKKILSSPLDLIRQPKGD